MIVASLIRWWWVVIKKTGKQSSWPLIVSHLPGETSDHWTLLIWDQKQNAMNRMISILSIVKRNFAPRRKHWQRRQWHWKKLMFHCIDDRVKGLHFLSDHWMAWSWSKSDSVNDHYFHSDDPSSPPHPYHTWFVIELSGGAKTIPTFDWRNQSVDYCIFHCTIAVGNTWKYR